MRNGSQPTKLLEKVRKARKRVLTRADVLKLGAGTSHPDRAMMRLVDEGFAEKLVRGIWLVPSKKRPNFDLSRFWSNPGLQDPLTISALVVRSPSTRDMARLVLAYGSAPAEQALQEMEVEKQISPEVARRSRRMLENVRQGLASAAV